MVQVKAPVEWSPCLLVYMVHGPFEQVEKTRVGRTADPHRMRHERCVSEYPTQNHFRPVRYVVVSNCAHDIVDFEGRY